MKSVLVTGAKGFLGRNFVKHFKLNGYITYGIGHGRISENELKEMGLDYWKCADVTAEKIQLNNRFDVIIHCGGSGSVRFSIDHPDEDYIKTVNSTIEVLEYMKNHNHNARLVYPSSPAVQGEHPDSPIEECYAGEPISPYGKIKKSQKSYVRIIQKNIC